MVEFSLGKTKYSVTRPKLREWLSIEKIRTKAIESAEKRDSKFVDHLLSYLSALLHIPISNIENKPWYEVVEGYYLSSIECSPKLDLSIISSSRKPKDAPDAMPDPWEYDERTWYSWCNMLSKAYGWNIQYNAELDVDDAIALIQEISLEDQFEKEWEWSLTEVAYEYNKSTKKSKLRTLPRPDWMKRASRFVADEIKKPKPVASVKPSFVPVGVVLLDEKENKDNTSDNQRSFIPL